MNFFDEISRNRVLFACFTAWFLAQVIKIILTLVASKKLDLSRLVGSGGMPSSHTSFVMALATAVGKIHGWSSSIFALSLCFAFVVMYDAAGVRRAAGYQAKILNIIIDDLTHNKRLENEKLKELIGHTPKEVLAGAVLGILVSNFLIR